MSDFTDMLDADVSAVFLNTAEFGETFWFYSQKNPAAPREITGVIDRGFKREQDEQFHRTSRQQIKVTVRNSETLGIDDPVQGDAIRLAEDEPGRRRGFVEELHRDAQMMVLLFRGTEMRQSGDRPRPL